MTSWEPYPELDEEQALALGRMTWAAVKLEGVIERVCGEALQHDVSGRSVSEYVKEVRGNFSLSPTTIGRKQALEWLTKAIAAIDRRNTVLHVTTELRFASDEEMSAGAGTLSLVNQRKRRVTRTEPTAGNFYRIRDAIEKAYAGWHSAEVGLVLERSGSTVIGDLDFVGAPNCAVHLTAMEATDNGWFCDECKVVRTET